MALSRIGTTADLANLFARSSIAACSNKRQSSPKLHASVIRQYPEAPQLPLPLNVSEIFNIETSRFAPERARDIATPLLCYNDNNTVDKHSAFSTAFNQIKMNQMDTRVESYDCFGAVSLNCSMQTNVPKPFCANGRSTYLNMPGGQWARDEKYLAESMKESHFKVAQMRLFKRNGGLDNLVKKD